MAENITVSGLQGFLEVALKDTDASYASMLQRWMGKPFDDGDISGEGTTIKSRPAELTIAIGFGEGRVHGQWTHFRRWRTI